MMQPVPDGTLVNGDQQYNCPLSLRTIDCQSDGGKKPSFRLDPSKEQKLRLINTGYVTVLLPRSYHSSVIHRSLAQIHFSVEDHWLEIIEADGTNLTPVLVEELPIAAGQRYAVILRPKERAVGRKQFVMHTRLDQECFTYVYVFSHLDGGSPADENNIAATLLSNSIKEEVSPTPLPSSLINSSPLSPHRQSLMPSPSYRRLERSLCLLLRLKLFCTRRRSKGGQPVSLIVLPAGHSTNESIDRTCTVRLHQRDVLEALSRRSPALPLRRRSRSSDLGPEEAVHSRCRPRDSWECVDVDEGWSDVEGGGQLR